MGRPPKKPAELEAKQGFPGRRKRKTKRIIQAKQVAAAEDAPAAAPIVLADVPPAPDWLDDYGKAVWVIVVSDVVRRNVAKPSDYPELARYCDHSSTWRKLRDETRTPKGRLRVVYTTTTATGGKRKLRNPAFDAMLQLEIRLKDYEDRFGLNPQSRTALMTRLANTNDPDKPPLDPAGNTASGQQPAQPGSPLGLLNTTRARAN